MAAMMKFYLGTHMPQWLTRVDVPLFVAHQRIARDWPKNPKRSITSWAMDSGGFTELDRMSRHELRFTLSPQQYAARTRRYVDQIGMMDWAAPQDWMCEPFMLAKTGLTVEEHQRRTVRSVLDLRTLWPDGPFVPVLQGWERDDYLRHVELYDAAGIDLEAEATVGLGSVCRREATAEAVDIVSSLQPIRLHGFGMKKGAARSVGHLLASSDSLAWSYGGRRRSEECPNGNQNCANCLHRALTWRDELLAELV